MEKELKEKYLENTTFLAGMCIFLCVPRCSIVLCIPKQQFFSFTLLFLKCYGNFC